MKKIILFLGTFLLCTSMLFAQKEISGKVTSKEDGSALPGVTVAVKGTTNGTITDLQGSYKINVPANATTLVFTFVGMKSQEIAIGTQTAINAVLESSATQLGGMVVTALGISREKKSLGYSTQEVKGDLVSTVSTDNVTNALSGKIAGVQVKTTTNMGGSTNILLRGTKSITGDNQALFVVDGVPINNEVTNTASQQVGGVGYDYGNAASDINPDDIESINVLKGAAATALYGSRAANGVIMITTKKGSKNAKKGIGISITSGVTVGFVDKSTFPTYQKDYGAGYDAYWNTIGNETWAPTTDDASYGYHFNPNLLVYQWDAVDPQSPNYQKATPWVAATNGPITFFNHPVTLENSISLENANDNGSYHLSYTNYDQNGLMPNSNLKKNNVLFNGSWKVNDKLTATGSANFSTENALGRNSTGYSDNIMTSFREWDETNVDMKEQWNAYNKTKNNDTWNWYNPSNPAEGPAYWDNYYWTRYENYETDGRNRFIGNMSLDYKLASWVDIFGRISGDAYNAIQEERRAIGSVGTPFGIGQGADGSIDQSNATSGYLRRDITFSEYNYDVMANFNKDISKDLSLKGILGTNIRRTDYDWVAQSTGGGLVIPELYSLQNSAGPLPLAKELASKIGVNGIYAQASLGYKNYLYLDVTARQDHSSTLPVANSTYYYPSVAGSFIFTNVMPESKWLSFGKVRLNYAVVGNGAPFDQLVNKYNTLTPLNSAMTSLPTTDNDANLKPEKTKSTEGGIEMDFFKRRVGFDLALYNTYTTNQIMPLAVSQATGFVQQDINAGEIQNKGVELTLNGTPVDGKKFKWNVSVNWALNRNKVISLLPGVDNMDLAENGFGVSIDAHVGQPFGVLEGSDFTYLNGHVVVDSKGIPVPTDFTHIIGNVNPNWTGGITNTFTYQNVSFSFLIDVQDGGSIFSLDQSFGQFDGLYPNTDYINDLGNPVRNPLTFNANGTYASTSGGYIINGVHADGTVNTTRIDASTCDPNTGFGYNIYPDKQFVYDATYVKLREVSISYSLPSAMLKKCFLTGVTFSLVASNPWIIYKKLPYADPESGLGAGNLQGWSEGSLPSTHNYGFKLKLSF